MENIKQSLNMLGAALHLRGKRNEILASNIANAATPHYKARDIDFDEEIIIDEKIITLPDYWENVDKDELIFLLNNIKPTSSKVINNLLIESFIHDSSLPNNFTVDEFNYIRIVNLIKFGKRQKAFDMMNINIENQDNLDFYNTFKINYYFLTYEISQACDFSNSIDRKKTTINRNFLLKVDILRLQI